MAIDWSKVYTSHWRVFHVDKDTWADAEIVKGVDEVDITKDCDGEAPEIDSGSMSISASSGWEFTPGYYRISMTAEQAGEVVRVDVATLLCEAESGEVGYGVDVKDVMGRSVLHPAATEQVLAGEHVPKGGDGAAHAARLLRKCIAAPISVVGSFTMNDAYDFEFGTSYLEAAWEILNAANWCIQIEGNGHVIIREKPSEPALELNRANAKLLMPSISHELDYSEVPNRFTATDAGFIAQAFNTTGSPASYDQRGYWVDETDDSPSRINGETMQAYANRKLDELSIVHDVREYEREWWPGVKPFDIVRGSMGNVKLDGDMRVISQDISCGNGIVVEEHAAREVRAWAR